MRPPARAAQPSAGGALASEGRHAPAFRHAALGVRRDRARYSGTGAAVLRPATGHVAPPMLRRLTRHPRTQAAIAEALGGYLALVDRTTRWTILGEDNVTAAVAGGHEGADRAPGVIMGFWHERLAMATLAWDRARRVMPALQGARMHVLVSRHRDGRLIGDVGARFALQMVHGSSSRGGASGLIALARLLAAGDHVAITPDGPRGPRRRAAMGIAHLAALTGRPVLPVAAASSRVRLLGSWDRLMLPLPFGRGVLAVLPAIHVPRDGAEAALPAIEAALSAACDLVDRTAGGAAGRALGLAVPAMAPRDAA